MTHARLIPTLAGAALIGQATFLSADDGTQSGWIEPEGRIALVLPEGWQQIAAGPLVSLTSPDGDITLWFGLSDAADPAAVVADAWSIVGEPGIQPEAAVPAPPRDGVETATAFVYAPEGEVIRQAIAEARDGDLHVTLIRGTRAALDRRGAQVNIAVTGFLPAGAGGPDLAGVAPARLDAADLAALDAYVTEAMPLFDVPGAVVAVVQDGELRLLQGYGVRAQGSAGPMTPDTRLMVGSVGKTMTTLLMARLVEDGRLAWDQPVRDLLPGFAVADPALSGTITVQNLVCACSGVPRRDMEFLFNADELDAEAVIGSLAGFAFFTGFGEAFQYSNQLVATGGWVAAAATGARWGDLDAGYAAALQDRVFAPLGMTRSTLDFAEVLADADVAQPHAPHGTGTRLPLPLQTEAALLPVAPAGAHWSSGADMARYLQALIDLQDGTGLLSSEGFAHLTTPQVPVSATMSYGLGWFVEDWRGQRLVHHGGNTFGFTSELAFLPEAGAGIVILTNAGRANDFVQAVRARFLELLFDLPPVHHAGALIARAEAARRAADWAGAVPVDPVAAERAVGRYRSDVLGEITLRRDGARLIFDIGEMAGEVRVDPRQPDRWILWEGPLFPMPLAQDPATGALIFGEGATHYVFEAER
ncbi:serine hydrolase domain-containing protein [Roseicyclus persicicus]|uniref:Beta-lactamase family protein n=1 Tax=Roseicyclus persicicus TaxID=2650661 RepID=A0A7X6JYM9_9RHOB|nr:serine hydrolase domain-containing protein [Roseibacterium persicicum]NKX44654.1 beta-lactamase family protein [Roseibacterium persicicum]